MNLAQILEALPPRVYLRSGELVIQFSTPTDLAARMAETQAALADIERPETARSDGRTRGRSAGRSPTGPTGHGTADAGGDSEPRANAGRGTDRED
jgi:hypothetical protein